MMVGGVHRIRKRFIFSGAFGIITGSTPIAPKKGSAGSAAGAVGADGEVTYKEGIDTWAFFWWLLSGRYPRAFFVANQYGEWISFGARAATAGYLLNKYGPSPWNVAKKIIKKGWFYKNDPYVMPKMRTSVKPTALTGFGSPFGSAGPTFLLGAPIILNAVLSTGADEWAFNLTDNRTEREKMDFIAM